MGDFKIEAQLVGAEELSKAFNEAPKLAYTYVRKDMQQWGNKFRKNFIKDRMSGQGINWSNAKKVGKNVSSTVTGESLEALTFTGTISRFLRIHEEGGTIVPKSGGALAIPLVKGLPHKIDPGSGLVFVQTRAGKALLARREGTALVPQYLLVRSVTMKAKLGYLAYWQAHKQELVDRINASLTRAVRTAMERNIKKFSQALLKWAA